MFQEESFMNKKSYLLIVLFAFIVFSLISCKGGDVKVVLKLPDGFVSLIELNNREDKILRIILWERDIQVSFMDSDNICIYQTTGRDSSLIVKYKKEYFISEAKYTELTEIAILAQKERNRTYTLGDTVEILGVGKNYYVTITGVDEFALNNNRIFDIMFTVTPDTSMEELISIFSFAEITVDTRKGTGDLSNFIDTGTIRLEMKPDRRFDAIILKSPEYPGLTYRVLVDK